MELWQQILWGGIFMGICLLLQTAALVMASSVVMRLAAHLGHCPRALVSVVMILSALLFILVAVTIQVWIWAWVYVSYEALQSWNDAIYFSLVTFSTLGYGDITLEPGLRIFGAFASVTGVLAIGLGTAFLIALMTRLMKDRLLLSPKDD